MMGRKKCINSGCRRLLEYRQGNANGMDVRNFKQWEEIVMEKNANVAEMDYAEIVESTFQSKGLNFHVKKGEKESVFSLPMHADNAPGLNIRMRVSRKGDSKIWCYLAGGIAASKRAIMLEVVNALNDRYRYICVSVDEDNDICASHDFSLYGDEESAAEHAMETLFLVTNVMDHCVPTILKTLWMEDEDSDDGDKDGDSEESNIKMNPFD